MQIGFQCGNLVLLHALLDVQDGEGEQVADEEEELGDLQSGTGRLSAL